MKTFLLTIAAFFVISNYANSQNISLQEIFENYSGKEGFTSVNIDDPSALLGDDAVEEIGHIGSLKILTYDAKNKPISDLGKQFASDIKS
ncbi:MAG: hypothetical protein NT007_03250 [Candidatus Kapabacteria bacterium]|nr:hypothetical protein [Candidatus Kapabacteria bacterium]